MHAGLNPEFLDCDRVHKVAWPVIVRIAIDQLHGSFLEHPEIPYQHGGLKP